MPSPIPELASTEALIAHLDRVGDLRGAVVEGVDLGECDLDWDEIGVDGAVFIACIFPAGDIALRLQARGAVVVPDLTEDRPYRVYPSRLYSYEELIAVDEEIDAWFRAHPVPLGPVEAISQRLHDTAMTDAIYELIQPEDRPRRRVVGIMGGHGIRRDAPEYEAVVRLGHGLTAEGFFVATGGGPGLMEGANLGAYLTRGGEGAIEDALAVLATAPSVSHDDYAAAAELVHRAHARGEGGDSLAIPTWLYGHEPVGRFATHIAKYFANSIREDGLLQIADDGVVFARGGAGTVQEIFQDAAINAYSPPEQRAPMVFLGREFFTSSGIWELARTQAATADPPYDELLTLTDDVEEAVAAIAATGSAVDAERA
jgi:predicted Rossmann-fold nucleotide-binding protein